MTSEGMGIVPQVNISKEYNPGTVVPTPKLHPGDKTSCTIGHIEFSVNGQFNKTFPKIGIPAQAGEAVIESISILITREVSEGLLMPQGRVGGSKLCR
jgi:hypothetical protein